MSGKHINNSNLCILFCNIKYRIIYWEKILKAFYQHLNRLLLVKMDANDPNSIMDWFKRHGMDCSYAAREKLFHDAGLTGYRGTAQQNTILLKWLKQHFGP